MLNIIAMFIKDKSYSKEDIYQILQVPPEKQKGPWNTGYTKYNNVFYVFANVGVSGRTGHDYDNRWEGSNLIWYGKTNSNINQPLIKELLSGKLKALIFTRTNDRDPFTFNGEGFIKTYEPISPVKIIWSFKSEQLINPKEAWQLLLKNAKEFYKTNEIFVSPKNNHRYKIIGVTNDMIKIKRLDISSESEQELTYSILESAISNINKKDGVLSRSEVYKVVMIEAAIVGLLPMLDWDDDNNKIIYINEDLDDNISSLNRNRKIIEAPNDNDLRIITRQLRMRRGQNKLRENLFYLYSNSCCLTKVGIKQLLHACHIIPHSKSGVNSTTNV